MARANLRFNPHQTEVFTSGGISAFLTGRWYVRTWVKDNKGVWLDPYNPDNKVLMIELQWVDDQGLIKKDWWAEGNLCFALDGPVNEVNTTSTNN